MKSKRDVLTVQSLVASLVGSLVLLLVGSNLSLIEAHSTPVHYHRELIKFRNYKSNVVSAVWSFSKIDLDTTRYVNLFLPPLELDPTMCTKPTNYTFTNHSDSNNDSNSDSDGSSSSSSSIINRSYVEDQYQFNRNIALLVTMGGGCTNQQKKQNAMLLNQYYATAANNSVKNSVKNGPRISTLLIDFGQSLNDLDHVEEHDHAEDINDDHDKVHSDIHADDDDDDDDIITLLITTSAREYLHYDMNFASNPQKNDVYLNNAAFYSFDQPNRNKWNYYLTISGGDDDDRNGNSSGVGSMSSLFKWVYLLITITLSVPALYTCFLVWCSERRIIFRRNDRGRFIGMRIERRPNMHNRSTFENGNVDLDIHNMHMNMMTSDVEMASLFPIRLKQTLTNEQAAELPLIQYNVTNLEDALQEYHIASQEKLKKKKKNTTNDNTNDNNTNDNNTNDNNENDDQSDGIATTEATNEEMEAIIQIQDQPRFIQETYKSCTNCSVCFSDFKEGEEVRLLPRCGHIFHDVCVDIWLTERKNNCPLCQTTVIEHLHNDNNNDNRPTSNRPTSMSLSTSSIRTLRERERLTFFEYSSSGR